MRDLKKLTKKWLDYERNEYDYLRYLKTKESYACVMRWPYTEQEREAALHEMGKNYDEEYKALYKAYQELYRKYDIAMLLYIDRIERREKKIPKILKIFMR